ncbi:MAG TPA: hypothetical protein VLT32_06475, partial [Candidatus Sulfomarinibacteraceae bacterium]|nr:hypothetical protein [Candidatus Sulfomarinibacteraceae bacterium]
MARKARVAMVAVGVVAMMVDAIAVGAAATPEHEQRISAERAAALAVNDVAELGAGFRIDHPRRQVDLTPEGVRVVGRRGAPEWRWTLDGITASDGSALVATGPVAPLVVEPGLVRYDRCLLL